MANSAEVCADSGGVMEKWGGGLLIFFFRSLVCDFAPLIRVRGIMAMAGRCCVSALCGILEQDGRTRDGR